MCSVSCFVLCQIDEAAAPDRLQCKRCLQVENRRSDTPPVVSQQVLDVLLLTHYTPIFLYWNIPDS